MSCFKPSNLLQTIFIALLVMAGGQGQAHAADVTAILVDMTGLRLNSPSDRVEAERRIAWAADRIAGEPDIRDLKAMFEFGRNRDEIIRQADAQLDELVARRETGHGRRPAEPAASGLQVVVDGSKPAPKIGTTLSLTTARQACGTDGAMGGRG